uniref:Uncharacterized protein n=1 Tax=Avena sativa TaxID=4498 RepID=A0ACD5ZS80_AVESA
MRAAGISALLHLLATVLLLVAANVALPNCTSRCGNISIPYPFGVSAECHREGFKLDCYEKYHPPKLFMSSSRVEVLEISAQDNTMYIDSGILTLAGDRGLDGYFHMNWSVSLDHSLYRVLPDKNEVVILGCGVDVVVEWHPPDGGELAGTSCFLDCIPGQPVIGTDGTCSGTSCCRTDNAVFDSNMFLIKYTVEKEKWPVNSSLALVERKWWSEKNAMVLKEAVLSDTSLGDSSGILHTLPGAPIRTGVSWVFSSLSCAEASNSSDFGCLSDNSYCLDSTTGGYRCQCWHGYEGNPYEQHGCQGKLPDSLYN